MVERHLLNNGSNRVNIDSERWLIKEDGKLYYCEKLDECNYIKSPTSAGAIRKALAKIGVDMSVEGFERKKVDANV